MKNSTYSKIEVIYNIQKYLLENEIKNLALVIRRERDFRRDVYNKKYGKDI
jgi:hypothetical protein